MVKKIDVNNFNEDSAFKKSHKGLAIPYYSSWHYKVGGQTLNFIGNPRAYPNFTDVTLNYFFRLVKPCYVKAYQKILVSLIEEGGNFFQEGLPNQHFNLLLPLKIEGKFILSKHIMVPHIVEGTVVELVIINIQVKPYEGEPFIFEAHNSKGYDLHLTELLKKKICSELKFTARQTEMMKLINNGLSSAQIAKYLGKTTAAVHKMNRKLLNKISEYYGQDFINAKEAVAFHERSFG